MRSRSPEPRCLHNLSQAPHRWLERATARRALGGTWPLPLGRRQIFILPTRFGLLAAVASGVLLLVALNYQNGAVFLLDFVLVALGWIAMIACHRQLIGLELWGLEAPSVHAGEPLRLYLRLANPSRRERFGLTLYRDRFAGSPLRLDPESTARLALQLPPRPRGRYLLRDLGLKSDYPLGVFNAWGRIGPAAECFVYPRPADFAPPPPGDAGLGAAGRHGDQSEDFLGLVRYRPGDRPGQIAWHVYARTGEIQRKHFASGARLTRWFDLAEAPGDDEEQRLSVLARWLLDASRAGQLVGLRLPGIELAPDHGPAHLARCLRALACYPGPYHGLKRP